MPVNYTLSYTDSNSGEDCTPQDVISAASCINGNHKTSTFNIFASSCSNSTQINMTIFGTNILGAGAANSVNISTHGPLLQVIVYGRDIHFVLAKGGQVTSYDILFFGPDCKTLLRTTQNASKSESLNNVIEIAWPLNNVSFGCYSLRLTCIGLSHCGEVTVNGTVQLEKSDIPAGKCMHGKFAYLQVIINYPVFRHIYSKPRDAV